MLSEEQVLKKSRSNDLLTVKRLKCWGCKLSDISILTETPNLEILVLSCNKVDDISPLAKCSKLKELYLRSNLISSVEALQPLCKLESLKVLSLEKNPCTESPSYRQDVIELLPTLCRLDQIDIENRDISTFVRSDSVATSQLDDDQSVYENGDTSLPDDTNLDPYVTANGLSKNESISSLQRTATPCPSSPNVWNAILCLLDDLSTSDLEGIQKHITEKLSTRLNSTSLSDEKETC